MASLSIDTRLYKDYNRDINERKKGNIMADTQKANIIQVKGNNVIDTLMPEYDEMNNFLHLWNKNNMRGLMVPESGKFREAYNRKERAQRAVCITSDILRISENGLCQTVRIARRWYEKEHWMRCLPDDDANRLLEYMASGNSLQRR